MSTAHAVPLLVGRWRCGLILVGFEEDNYDLNKLPLYVSHYPAGVSTKVRTIAMLYGRMSWVGRTAEVFLVAPRSSAAVDILLPVMGLRRSGRQGMEGLISQSEASSRMLKPTASHGWCRFAWTGRAGWPKHSS